MAESVFLSRPTAELQQEYLAFYEEWVQSEEDMVPWVISRNPNDFPAMLTFLRNNEQGLNLPDGWVRSSTYWLVTESRKVVGVVNIRHQLTENLRNSGGHIGYGIRPSGRRKGYATRLLALSLEKAKELGIERALVVCDADNRASELTIRKNGGVEDTPYVEEDGNVILRFWITL